jgi:hypothetical protein
MQGVVVEECDQNIIDFKMWYRGIRAKEVSIVVLCRCAVSANLVVDEWQPPRLQLLIRTTASRNHTGSLPVLEDPVEEEVHAYSGTGLLTAFVLLRCTASVLLATVLPSSYMLAVSTCNAVWVSTHAHVLQVYQRLALLFKLRPQEEIDAYLER